MFADVRPPEQVIDLGRKARLECLTGGDESSKSEHHTRHHITWMKDGKLLPNRTRIVLAKHTLQIFNLQREDYGMYQCFVQAKGASNTEVQATSELRLGGEIPTILSIKRDFVYTEGGFA